MFKKFPYHKYRIEWLDISGETGWGSVETAKKMEPQLAITEAYLLHEDENKIITFATYYENEDEGLTLGDRNVFPKGCILKMKRI